jgi:hypothetical protein
MNDTSPEIERMVRERFRAMTPQERFAIGCQMFETARAIVMASFPPGLAPAQVRWLLCERFYGENLAREAYGPYPDPAEVRQLQRHRAAGLDR